MTEWNDGRLDELGKRVDDQRLRCGWMLDNRQESIKSVTAGRQLEGLERKIDDKFSDVASDALSQCIWGFATRLIDLIGVIVTRL